MASFRARQIPTTLFKKFNDFFNLHLKIAPRPIASRTTPHPTCSTNPSNRLAVGRIVWFGEVHLLRIILKAFDLIGRVTQKRLLVLVEGEIVLSVQPVLNRSSLKSAIART
jgi:hypothetical protein